MCEKNFDAMAMTRSIRLEIFSEISSMTSAEEIAWLESSGLNDQMLDLLRVKAIFVDHNKRKDQLES